MAADQKGCLDTLPQAARVLTSFLRTEPVPLGGSVASGVPSATVASQLRQRNPTLTPKNANSIVDNALIYLCPQLASPSAMLPDLN